MSCLNLNVRFCRKVHGNLGSFVAEASEIIEPEEWHHLVYRYDAQSEYSSDWLTQSTDRLMRWLKFGTTSWQGSNYQRENITKLTSRASLESLRKDEGNGNSNASKPWSDWLNKEK